MPQALGRLIGAGSPLRISLLLLAFLDEVCEVALAAVVAVEMHRHEDTGPADLVRALAAQARDLVVAVHLVELQDCELHLLALVLDLLRLGVSLLLALLAATGELEVHEDGRLISEAAGAERRRRVQGLAGEDQALLLCRDAPRGGNLLLQTQDLGIGVGAHGQGLARLTNEELHRFRARAPVPAQAVLLEPK